MNLELPPQFCNPFLRFVRLDGKRAIDSAWTTTGNYAWSDTELEAWRARGGNYGVCCGFGGLLVLDFDHPEAEARLLSKLPPTFRVRTGRGGTHLYFTSDKPATMRVNGPDGKRWLDVQGEGTQVVGPGSIHPDTRRPYEVVVDLQIAELPYGDLLRLLRSEGLITEREARESTAHGTTKGHITAQPGDGSLRGTIQEKLPLVEIAEEYGVSIDGRGLALCVFHSERRPSLSFGPIGCQRFKCHSCNARGDVLTFLMHVEKCTMDEAVEIACKRVGIKRTSAPMSGAARLIAALSGVRQ